MRYFLGFDDQGRQFDLDGNLVDWWQPQTTSNFLKRAKCIIEQYGNYTEPSTGLKVIQFLNIILAICDDLINLCR